MFAQANSRQRSGLGAPEFIWGYSNLNSRDNFRSRKIDWKEAVAPPNGSAHLQSEKSPQNHSLTPLTKNLSVHRMLLNTARQVQSGTNAPPSTMTTCFSGAICAPFDPIESPPASCIFARLQFGPQLDDAHLPLFVSPDAHALPTPTISAHLINRQSGRKNLNSSPANLKKLDFNLKNKANQVACDAKNHPRNRPFHAQTGRSGLWNLTSGLYSHQTINFSSDCTSLPSCTSAPLPKVGAGKSSKWPVETGILESPTLHIELDSPKVGATIAHDLRPAPPQLLGIMCRGGQGVNVNKAALVANQRPVLKAVVRKLPIPPSDLECLHPLRQRPLKAPNLDLRGPNWCPPSHRRGPRTLAPEFARQGCLEHDPSLGRRERLKRRPVNRRFVHLRDGWQRKHQKRDTTPAT